ncbi:MAG: S1 RNA-binding domain-containing protein, partial [Mycoplasmatales bacterium]
TSTKATSTKVTTEEKVNVGATSNIAQPKKKKKKKPIVVEQQPKVVKSVEEMYAEKLQTPAYSKVSSTERERKIKVRKKFVPQNNKQVQAEENLFGFEIKDLKVGELFDCRVIEIVKDGYIVQVEGAYKEGIIENDQVETKLEVGSVVKAVLYRVYDEVNYLSLTKADLYNEIKNYESKFEEKQIVKGKIVGFERNNFKVKLDNGVNASIFIRNLDTTYIANPEPYIGHEYEFLIKKILPTNNCRFELTRRELLVEQEKETAATIEVNSVITVKNFTANKAGLEFNYKGLRGFIPFKETSHSFVKDVNDLDIDLTQEHDVLVLEKKQGKFGVGIVGSFSRLMASPWDTFIEKYTINDQVTAPIVNKKDYGLFVQIIPGVRGLLHRNEFNSEFAAQFKEVQINQEITTFIDGIDHDKKLVSLSMIDKSQVETEETVVTDEVAQVAENTSVDVTSTEDVSTNEITLDKEPNEEIASLISEIGEIMEEEN